MIDTLVVILSAGLRKGKTGHWENTGLTKADNYWGAPGGKLRAKAAYYLIQNNPTAKILVTGGLGYDIKIKNQNRPKLYQIMTRELIDLGVEKKKIIEEKKSNNTYQQLKVVKRFAGQKGIKKIIVLSNRYHIPRIKAFLNYVDDFKNFQGRQKISFIVAETIVAHWERQWRKKIILAYRSQWLKDRAALEKKGIKDLKLGIYKLI